MLSLLIPYLRESVRNSWRGTWSEAELISLSYGVSSRAGRARSRPRVGRPALRRRRGSRSVYEGSGPTGQGSRVRKIEPKGVAANNSDRERTIQRSSGQERSHDEARAYNDRHSRHQTVSPVRLMNPVDESQLGSTTTPSHTKPSATQTRRSFRSETSAKVPKALSQNRHSQRIRKRERRWPSKS